MLLFLLYCFAAILFVITSYVWIFEYLGGPTFKKGGPTFEWGGPILGERVLENMPTPRFEQPHKFIAHGCIFESLWYINFTVIIESCYSLV